jgi:hypothetical protein
MAAFLMSRTVGSTCAVLWIEVVVHYINKKCDSQIRSFGHKFVVLHSNQIEQCYRGIIER